jgi:hypothetical protein
MSIYPLKRILFYKPYSGCDHDRIYTGSYRHYRIRPEIPVQGIWRIAALADDRLPGVRGCFGDGRHIVFRTGVPSDTGTEENFCLIE